MARPSLGHGAQGRQEPDRLGQEHPEDHAGDGDGRRRAPAPGRAAHRGAAALRGRDPADDAPGGRGGAGTCPNLPILNEHESEDTVGILLVTGDRGLAGAFNSQIVRAGVRAARRARGRGQVGRLVRVRAPRRVVADVPRPRGRRASYTGFTDRPAYANAREIASDLMAAYVDGEVDRVEIFYNGYVSPLTQEVTRETLLPLQQASILEDEDEDDGRARGEGDDDEQRARARSSSTSPTRRRSSSGSSPPTWRSRSTARCSSPPRPSTARA